MSRRIYATRERGDFAWYGPVCGESLCLVRGCASNGRVNSSSMFLCYVSNHQPSENGASECRGVRTLRPISVKRERGDLAWYGLGCGESWRLVRGCALNGRVNSNSMYFCYVSNH